MMAKRTIKQLLPVLILLSLALGILGAKAAAWFPAYAETPVAVCKWLGDAFLSLLKMVVAPLVFSSIVAGVANIGSASSLGRITGKTLGLFVLTMLVAVIVGLTLVNLFRPGAGIDLLTADAGNEALIAGLSQQRPTVGKILMDAIPANVAQAFADNNMLQIIVFAVLFGFFINRIPAEYGKKVLDFFQGVFQVMIRMTEAIILLTPIGVFGITVAQFSGHGDLWGLLSGLGVFILTVLLGIALQFFVVIPLFLKAGGVAPYRYMKQMLLPLVTALTTASSTATLPLSMDAAENKAGISNKITSFVLPLGATVNMNGTALFECVSVLFLAQAYGVHLAMSQQVVVVATSLLAAIGTAGIPMAGFVMMTVILTAVGLPLEGIGLIMSVNVILDMPRTAANVWGDCAVAAIVARSEGEKLTV